MIMIIVIVLLVDIMNLEDIMSMEKVRDKVDIIQIIKKIAEVRLEIN